jgi:perosamine synthetase
MDKLAIDGGTPVRARPLPYGRQWIDDDDVEAVIRVLRSDWLTTGPRVAEFERAFAGVVGASDAIAVSNGTAALHAAMHAIGAGPGDEVIVPALTFVASANCALYEGATPVITDVTPGTLLLDPAAVEANITPRTKVMVPVDYAGQPCDYGPLTRLAKEHGIKVVADACHALGARYRGTPVGRLADLTVFSLHPVKHITAGEGGVVATEDQDAAAQMRRFRNHGISADHRERSAQGSWFYDVEDLGYNYRLTDFQCALGLSQLRKLPGWLARRRQIAGYYDRTFGDVPGIRPLAVRPDAEHAYHLYVVEVDPDVVPVGRARIFAALRAEGITVNVHYIPVHLHPLYRRRFGTGQGLCPVAEQAYERILSLPLYAGMTDDDAATVVEAVQKVIRHYAR